MIATSFVKSGLLEPGPFTVDVRDIMSRHVREMRSKGQCGVRERAGRSGEDESKNSNRLWWSRPGGPCSRPETSGWDAQGITEIALQGIWISQRKNPEMTSSLHNRMTVRPPCEFFEEDLDALGTRCLVNGMVVNAFLRLIECHSIFYYQHQRVLQ